jgi:hypothetical protein
MSSRVEGFGSNASVSSAAASSSASASSATQSSLAGVDSSQRRDTDPVTSLALDAIYSDQQCPLFFKMNQLMINYLRAERLHQPELAQSFLSTAKNNADAILDASQQNSLSGACIMPAESLAHFFKPQQKTPEKKSEKKS